MLFGLDDLDAAFRFFDLLVGGDLSRALNLEPVVRWSPKDWATFAPTTRAARFNPRDPRHVEALQLIIDRACERQLKREPAIT
jgi:hypothetical protein